MGNTKILFFDLDGTLLNKQGQISDSNKEALNLINHSKNIFTFSTGRSIDQVLTFAEQANIKHWIICNSGAVLYHPITKEIKTYTKIPKDMVYFFIKIAKKYNRQLNIKLKTKSLKYYFGNNSSKEINRRSKFWSSGATLNPKYDNFNNFSQDINFEDIVCVSIKAEPKIIREITKEIKPIFSLMWVNFDISSISDVYLEASLKKITKAFGINLIINELKINKDDVYVFGDSENDIPMFKEFKNSIAMRNAKFKIRKYASKIIGSNASDSILKFINKKITSKRF